MTDGLPDEVQQLLDERARHRVARDFQAADAVRDQLRALGWEVMDSARGSTARPVLPDAPVATGFARPEDLESRLGEPATLDASVQLVADDHPDDLHRMLRGLAAHRPMHAYELIIVANAPAYDLDALLEEVWPEPLTVLRTSARLGWADARNLGLRRSLGRVTIMLDTSLEPTGNVIDPLVSAFDDPSVGVAGGWGVTSSDGRQFEDAPPGEVDAIEGYCLAARREVLRDVGLFDRHFRFYRNADLEFSFAARDAGWRAVRLAELPFERHEHRGYASLPEAERDRLSKRNFYRFLKRWGDRRDLLLRPGPPHTHDHEH
jgi:GT2 family glycosyltransferase